MPSVPKTVANSKLLAEATKQAVEKNDEGSKYIAQFAIQTPAISGLSSKQVSTFLGKCKQALANFKDDLNLDHIGVSVNLQIAELEDVKERLAKLKKEYEEKVLAIQEEAKPFLEKQREYDNKIVQDTHAKMIEDLGLEVDSPEASSEES